MKKSEIIKSRNTERPTCYRLAGKYKKIMDIGLFYSLVHRMWDQGNQIQNTFKLAAITLDFVYYIDEGESDETSCIVMLNRRFELISDNFFASNDLAGLIERNEGLLWISNPVKYWQMQQFVQPKRITAKIKNMLEQVNEKELTQNERIIYFAYRNNGPVKYSKPHSLMAVISNDLDQAEHSSQLVAIIQMLEYDAI